MVYELIFFKQEFRKCLHPGPWWEERISGPLHSPLPLSILSTRLHLIHSPPPFFSLTVHSLLPKVPNQHSQSSDPAAAAVAAAPRGRRGCGGSNSHGRRRLSPWRWLAGWRRQQRLQTAVPFSSGPPMAREMTLIGGTLTSSSAGALLLCVFLCF